MRFLLCVCLLLACVVVKAQGEEGPLPADQPGWDFQLVGTAWVWNRTFDNIRGDVSRISLKSAVDVSVGAQVQIGYRPAKMIRTWFGLEVSRQFFTLKTSLEDYPVDGRIVPRQITLGEPFFISASLGIDYSLFRNRRSELYIGVSGAYMLQEQLDRYVEFPGLRLDGKNIDHYRFNNLNSRWCPSVAGHIGYNLSPVTNSYLFTRLSLSRSLANAMQVTQLGYTYPDFNDSAGISFEMGFVAVGVSAGWRKVF